MPNARSRISSAAVPLPTPTACRAPLHAATCRSNSSIFGPNRKMPESITSSAAASSSGFSRRDSRDNCRNGTSPAAAALGAEEFTRSPPHGCLSRLAFDHYVQLRVKGIKRAIFQPDGQQLVFNVIAVLADRLLQLGAFGL